MRTLQFFLLLLFVGLLGFGLLSYALYDSPVLLWQGLDESVATGQSLREKLQLYFQDAGSWNYLILSFLIATCLILFVINDLFLGARLHIYQNKGFFISGFFGLIRRIAAIGLLVLELVVIANLVVVAFANSRMYYAPEKVAGKHSLLLLGTSKYLQENSGHLNLYYQQRIDAVVELVQANRVKHIIISGDNGRVGYNEPADMQQSLIARGIPESMISLDYAGFRTLDSIVRLKGHFKVASNVLVVSQRFHVERALALAWSYGVDAYGYPAKGGATRQMMLRELLAKPKALLDVFVFNMQPKYGKTYAKSAINWNNPRDKQFSVVVGCFWLFAFLLIFMFYIKK